MILYVNSKNEVKDVNTTSDTSLTALEVKEEFNPFAFDIPKKEEPKKVKKESQKELFRKFHDKNRTKKNKKEFK